MKKLSSVLEAWPVLRFQYTNGCCRQFTVLATQKHKALGLPDETLRSEVLRQFLGNLGSEIAPVTAVLGGQITQDVINVLGGTSA